VFFCSKNQFLSFVTVSCKYYTVVYFNAVINVFLRHAEIEEPSTKTIQLPMSIISERHQDQIFTPVLPPEQLCRFGEVYEANLFQVLKTVGTSQVSDKNQKAHTFPGKIKCGFQTGCCSSVVLKLWYAYH